MKLLLSFISCLLAVSGGIIGHRRFIMEGDADASWKIGRATVKDLPNTTALTISSGNEDVLRVSLGGGGTRKGQPWYNEGSKSDSGEIKNLWSGEQSLKIRHFKRQTSDCYTVQWKGPTQDCISMSGADWFGGSEMHYQYWPINNVNISFHPYVSHDTTSSLFGSVLERYFVSSRGVAVWVDEDLPLFASINNMGYNNICLLFNNTDPYSYDSASLKPFIYEICTDTDIMAVHKNMANAHFKKPTGIPAEHLFRKPIWSTWAQFKHNINQTVVLDFLDAILRNNFSIGQLEIDEVWTPHYGDLVFNNDTFPDPTGMIRKIHAQNLPVALWVPPFLNPDAERFKTAASKGYLVMDPTRTKPALIKWWEGTGAGVVDFTNPAAAQWFVGELRELQKLGVDTFKFDGGETTYLPVTPYKLFNGAGNPDSFVSTYARTIATVDPGRRQEYRTGVHTQDLPIMVRMIDKSSVWGYSQGLKTLIPTALTFGLFGYPFVLPDYIGGNGYDGQVPDSEMYIRWAQANALMPFMQFSYTPWFFNNDTVVRVTRDMIELHEKYSDLLISLARNSMVTGEPIMRPMWWLSANDTAALNCDSQFLLGNDVVVAPVLDKGVDSRSIYLPVGRWKDELTGKIRTGPVTFTYPVSLEDLPRFTRTT